MEHGTKNAKEKTLLPSQTSSLGLNTTMKTSLSSSRKERMFMFVVQFEDSYEDKNGNKVKTYRFRVDGFDLLDNRNEKPQEKMDEGPGF